LKFWIKWLQGKRLISLYQFANCLYPLSSKFLTQSICHMCTCKQKYWCTIMYACEKSLAPHELFYLMLLNCVHSFFFHVIVIFKSSPKECWSFYSFFWNSNCDLHKKFEKNSTIIHQTWTCVENCQIVIIFCLHYIRSLHSPCPIVWWACNNYMHLLTNWMPSKTFVCGGVWACKNKCMSIDH